MVRTMVSAMAKFNFPKVTAKTALLYLAGFLMPFEMGLVLLLVATGIQGKIPPITWDTVFGFALVWAITASLNSLSFLTDLHFLRLKKERIPTFLWGVFHMQVLTAGLLLTGIAGAAVYFVAKAIPTLISLAFN